MPEAVAQPLRITTATYAIFFALFFLFFGRHFLGFSSSDWIGAAAFSWSGVFLRLGRGGEGFKAQLTALILCGVLAGASCFPIVGARDLSLETGVLIALGISSMFATIWLGTGNSQPDRETARLLWVFCGVLLFTAGLALRKGASPYFQSGMIWRWSGVLALWAAFRVRRFSSRYY
ncbi:MAG: hypothetical protein HY921_11975 [Elusimicrobia bacterium]|nr:hypothetical protein [Elusimicrobiota bacterium]